MPTLLKSCLPLLLAVVLVGCEEDISGITFESFTERVANLAGDDAQDCGEAAVDEGADQNQCVAINFANQMAAYAIYNEQGIDSQVANALAVTAEGRVFSLFFDSDPTGGSGAEANGVIEIFECLEPRLSGVTDNLLVSVFICEGVDAQP